MTKGRMSTLYLLFFLQITLILIPKSTPIPVLNRYYCPNSTLFASDTKYESNLNMVFRNLNSNATTPSGYSKAIAGKGTDNAVYGQFLCRGDQSASSCQDCVSTATMVDLPQNYCPNGKEAIIWYDQCMIRYSNKSIFGRLDIPPRFEYKLERNITGNYTLFAEVVTNLMNDVALRAANGGPEKKFAADSASFTSFQTVYGLAQCMPDLSIDYCYQCLQSGIRWMPPISLGGRVGHASCFMRFEVYPFFKNIDTSPPSTDTDHAGKKNDSTKLLIAIIVPVVAIVALLAIGSICVYKKRTKTRAIETREEPITVESLQYNFATLELATNKFSDENKLGEGGFGCVYKGALPNGREIAVKRLSGSSNQGEQEFKSEVLLVAKLQHRNLVVLLGFCLEGHERLLVYEYVPNKSLDCFLFDPTKKGILDWERRHKIIGGIARGMAYLHHDSQLRIIHRDLKASNVLLDRDMNPKISDFGTARIFGVDQSEANTSRVVGTYGYMSPEYLMNGEFSTKSDVYSFGVLVLELISGKKTNTFRQDGNFKDLASYAWELWRDEKPLELVDSTIKHTCSYKEVMRCLHLGLLCTPVSVDDRPTMATVLLALNSHSVTLPIPNGKEAASGQYIWN